MFSLKTFTLFALIAAATSSSSSSITEISDNFHRGIEYFKRNYGHYETRGVKVETILSIFERSIYPEECIASRISDLEFEDLLSDLTSEGGIRNDNDELRLLFILLQAGIPCSDKTRPVNDFVFDLILSFGHIVRAFKDEPELSKFAMLLKCANNFGIENNIIDPSEYPVDRNNPEEEYICEAIQNFFEEAMLEMPECLQIAVNRTIHNKVRTLILTQTEWTPEKLQFESLRHFHENMDILDEFGRCGIEIIDTIADIVFEEYGFQPAHTARSLYEDIQEFIISSALSISSLKRSIIQAACDALLEQI